MEAKKSKVGRPKGRSEDSHFQTVSIAISPEDRKIIELAAQGGTVSSTLYPIIMAGVKQIIFQQAQGKKGFDLLSNAVEVTIAEEKTAKQ